MKGCSKVQQIINNAGKTDSKKYNRKGEEEVGSQERKKEQAAEFTKPSFLCFCDL